MCQSYEAPLPLAQSYPAGDSSVILNVKGHFAAQPQRLVAVDGIYEMRTLLLEGGCGFPIIKARLPGQLYLNASG
jgi:hypothetical protein